MANLIGSEFGNYRITDRLGSRGLAEVYCGIHIHLDRPVVAKIFHCGIWDIEDFAEWFKREAKVAGNLDCVK